MAREDVEKQSTLTRFERALSVVSPKRAFEMSVARTYLNRVHEFGYDGANPGKLRGSSGKKSKNAAAESWRIQKDRYNLMWDARDMEKQFSFVSGALDRMEEYTVGQVSYESRTGDSDVDREIEDYFHDWCERSDIAGRFRLSEMLRQGYRGWKRDGEFGWIVVEDGEEFRLQSIEADRIGSPDRPDNDEYNIGGIQIDDLGAVTGYDIYNRSRQAQYTLDQTVDPESFIHLFKANRAAQYHGITSFAQALPHARDIYELFALEKQAMKFAAAFAGFIRRNTGFGGADWKTKKPGDSGVGNSFAAEAGMVKRLADGEEVQFPSATGRPSANLMQFVDLLKAEMAMGLNLPYGFLFDMARLGGVTARVEVFLAMRTIRQDQLRLERIFLNRVRDLVIERAIAFGHVTPHPNWRSGKWNFGPKLTGDTGHDTQSKIMKMLSGLGTGSAIVEEEDGGTFEEVMRGLAREVKTAQEVAAEMNVPIELMMPSRWTNPSQLLAAINSPPFNPPEPKGLVAQQGKDAAGLVLDVLEKYADALLERESAIQALVALVGMTRAKAEKIVPVNRPKPERTGLPGRGEGES